MDIYTSVFEPLQQKVASTGFASLAERERLLFAVAELEAELNNGGFDQYFFNSSGDHAAEAHAGLVAIGASATADLLQQACALFPEAAPSPDTNTRQEQLLALTDTIPDAFEELDRRFLAYVDDLAQLLARWWSATQS